MIQGLRFFLYAVIIVFAFTSCEKELSYESGGVPVIITDSGSAGGTAQYSFNGGTAVCTGAILSGTFTSGAAATAANTVVLKVTVESTGTYVVTTSAVNGISFSGSGTFSATGIQDITLTATGTPVASGSFNFTTGSGGCTFSVVVNPAGGSASVFTFDGGTGNCTGAVLNGIYIAGTALNASNTVILSVNVTTAGAYSINTPAVNGVSFSGSGTLSTTGTQIITLTGTGIPTAAGTFTYTPPGGCSFSVTVDNSSTTVTDYFFDITIDGARIQKYANVTADYSLGYGSYGAEDIAFGSIISPAIDPVPLGSYYFEIVKGSLLGGATASPETFKNFFNTGSHPYADPGSPQGISIVYTDLSGKTWQSDFAPGTQTGSTFSITSSSGSYNDAGEYVVKFTATFTCKLYDDAGNSITLTNGKFSGEFKQL